MPEKKTLSTLLAMGALVAVGATTALAVEVYHRPMQVAFGAARLLLRAKGAHEAICEIDGLPMHYLHAGKLREPVVLIHGLGGSAEAWVTLMPMLSHKFEVYAPDMPGFGCTPLAPGKQCISTHVAYLGHFLDRLNAPQVTLVGHSLGGWIALRYAAEHPTRVKRLYLLNSAGLMREGTFVPYAPDREAARAYIQRLLCYYGPVPTFLLDAVVSVSREPAYSGFIANYDRAEDVDEILARITIPTTIVWGTEDRIFPLTCAYDFHAGIPNSRLVLVPGVSHNSHTGAAKKVARLIREDASKEDIARDQIPIMQGKLPAFEGRDEKNR